MNIPPEATPVSYELLVGEGHAGKTLAMWMCKHPPYLGKNMQLSEKAALSNAQPFKADDFASRQDHPAAAPAGLKEQGE